MQFYFNHHQDAAWNLAMEELLWRSGRHAFMLWQNAPAVIVGRHQNTLQEVNGALARERGIAVVRRVTGGGAVYHDLGNINFSLIAPSRPWTPEFAAQCLEPLLTALTRLGAKDCRISGRNDILCGGVKISGCARSIQKNRMLFHGTLLYDADLSVLGEVLTPDADKIRTKGITSVRARVGNLRSFLGPDAPETPEFLQMLTAEIARSLQVSGALPLPEELLKQAEDLAERKYRTRVWNHMTPFPCNAVRKKQFSSGWVTAEMQICRDRLDAVRFTGDFFAEQPVAELENGLAGTVPEYGVLLKKLRQLNAAEYISGVSAEDLAELLCV